MFISMGSPMPMGSPLNINEFSSILSSNLIEDGYPDISQSIVSSYRFSDYSENYLRDKHNIFIEPTRDFIV